MATGHWALIPGCLSLSTPSIPLFSFPVFSSHGSLLQAGDSSAIVTYQSSSASTIPLCAVPAVRRAVVRDQGHRRRRRGTYSSGWPCRPDGCQRFDSTQIMRVRYTTRARRPTEVGAREGGGWKPRCQRQIPRLQVVQGEAQGLAVSKLPSSAQMSIAVVAGCHQRRSEGGDSLINVCICK